MIKNQSQRPIPVMAFVDWNAQIHAAKRSRTDIPGAERVLAHVAKRIIEALVDFLADYRFEVRLRLYCGWHKGFEPTSRRKELSKIVDEDLFSLSTHRNIAIRSLAFGDTALGALNKRIVRSTNSHFPGTCRDRGYQGVEEKMVDTALISDLIYAAARDDDGAWLAVMGEDVDLMPGVYTAEGLLATGSRKIAYLRKTTEPYLECKDLQLFHREER
jgi:hypothetical protein